MVIQRWQSVYLLVAIFAMALTLIRPWGYEITTTPEGIVESIAISPWGSPVNYILNVLIAILLAIDIFLFKNLKQQRTVAAVAILLIIASAATFAISMFPLEANREIEWSGAPVGLFCALVCTFCARYRMGRDQAILNSYNRLR